MQYPQIQFYKGSLVRLASGKLKQVEDLSSDDFLEGARLISRSTSNCNNCSASDTCICFSSNNNNNHHINPNHHHQLTNGHSNNTHRLRSIQGRLQQVNNPYSLLNHRANSGSVVDENNNSVFNSPEPTPSFDSPTMEMDEDEELDVVSNDDHLLHHNGNSRSSQCSQSSHTSDQQRQQQLESCLADDNLYIDSSVVKDFLEVGPPASSASPTLSTSSQNTHSNNDHLASYPSTSSSSPTLSLGHPSCQQNLTVLIKFFLESSRSIVFIEVPIEHPFFVFHRGWSSWNPQRTYDKFGLKCRKLKIGDTCISLIRQQPRKQTQQQESDQCNILFSSIKINE